MRKSVLETKLGSIVFLGLLKKDNGCNTTDLSKMIGFSYSGKISKILKRMYQEGLVNRQTVIRETKRGKRKSNVYTINYEGFVDLLNKRLPNPLNSKEKKIFAKFLRENLKKIAIFFVNPMLFLICLSFLLATLENYCKKYGVSRSKKLERSKS